MTMEIKQKTRNGIAPYLFIAPIAFIILFVGFVQIFYGFGFHLLNDSWIAATLGVSVAGLIMGLLHSKGRWLCLVFAGAYSITEIIFDTIYIFREHSGGTGYAISISDSTGIPAAGFSVFSGLSTSGLIKSLIVYLLDTFSTVLIVALPLATLLLALNHSKKVKAQIL